MWVTKQTRHFQMKMDSIMRYSFNIVCSKEMKKIVAHVDFSFCIKSCTGILFSTS